MATRHQRPTTGGPTTGAKPGKSTAPKEPAKLAKRGVAAAIEAGQPETAIPELAHQPMARDPGLETALGRTLDPALEPHADPHHVLERAPLPAAAQPRVKAKAKRATPPAPKTAPAPAPGTEAAMSPAVASGPDAPATTAQASSGDSSDSDAEAAAEETGRSTHGLASIDTPQTALSADPARDEDHRGTPIDSQSPEARPADSPAETAARRAPPAVPTEADVPSPPPLADASKPPEASTRAERSTPGRAAAGSPVPEALPLPDLNLFAQNMGKLIDFSGKVAAAYLKPRETGEIRPSFGEEIADSFKTMSKVAESWFVNPTRMFQAQADLTTKLFGLWGESVSRFGSGPGQPPATVERKTDRRFAAPEWRDTPMHDFLHQAYLVTTDWAKRMIDDAEGVDGPTREKAAFYLRQVSSAMSPANFLATNPELIKETFRENGENLVRGMKMLAEDIEAGRGELKIRQSDASQFKLGVDMAATPGKVVFRNDLMELIQYAPATETVLKRPLLIVPPWINKFYVLDLNKEKSFIRWMVSQGLTVFVISWVNPDERHAAKDWDAYMREGIFTALDAIAEAVDEREVTAVGYCVGGTLLAATLAYMAAKGDRRIASATLLTTQVDFQHAGDLKVFADEAQIRAIEAEMGNSGYLPGSKMANAFNMLRPDELIWSYAVNTYIKGKPPAAFDLLAWNADSTRMTAANHAFYLRNLYLENRLTAGEMVLGGERLNLGLVTVPIYDLATREDHIAPARSVFSGARFFGGEVRYVLAGSGHIAGVVNPPAKAKYQFWTGGKPEGRFEDWLAAAIETKGTWWPDWFEWLRAQAPETVPPRESGAGGLKPLCDAPGEYVRVAS